MIDTILHVKTIVIVPIIVQNKSIGVFAFGSRTDEVLSVTETNFLKGLSSQIGLYLQQAWVIKSLLMQRDSLTKTNDHLREVVRIKRSFMLSLAEILDEKVELASGSDYEDHVKAHVQYMNALLLMSEKSSDE
jgi:GAF domain-containing protein